MQGNDLLYTKEELKHLFRIYRVCLFREHEYLHLQIKLSLNNIVKHYYSAAHMNLKNVLMLLDMWETSGVKELKHFAKHYLKFFEDFTQKIVDQKRSEGYVLTDVRDREK